LDALCRKYFALYLKYLRKKEEFTYLLSTKRHIKGWYTFRSTNNILDFG